MSVTDEEILFLGSSIELRVNKQVYECWLKHRQMKPKDTEQFGALIGSRGEGERSIWIDRCTTPQKKDVSQRAWFVMKDPVHQKTIDKAFENSSGELGYIGTWHTHPQNVPEPSSIDLNDWEQCTLRNPDRQLVFAIVGNTQVNLYIKINGDLEVATRKIDG
ncbi:TPA: Mov34/MPN/PAD-1 family protein [Vibrio vulnificus]|nr:Mov34/MPN/PAD-1 family protein [Vibrio vulnificus]HDY7746303.1 Mov34/MPN/PAD-1 family protein [Vibrio vulnificus]HDY7755898.1 Mov34/MPN/PAD-1 family protein [Vibrio vulnificus]HDY7760315.1 Mov34/MPN/PAD-1 family protein [Vibrio vulnificus]HDY7769438.1 Mov34/MPN/PAD-1 family protein [Vibrio vulnificus]